MQNTAFAGATMPRFFILFDLWGQEAARLVCSPADLRAELDLLAVFGLTAAHRAELSESLFDMCGRGRYSAMSGDWTLTSEPIPAGVLAGALAAAVEG